MRCAEALRVQAYFDDEVDAVSAAEMEQHIERCAECGNLLHDLRGVREALRADLSYATTPPPLREQVMRALERESALEVASSAAPPRKRSQRAFWAGAFSGVGGVAIAATLAFFLVTPHVNDPLLDDLIVSHLRSLMPAHLIDVVSTDKHTVKPWFAGHSDVSPAVADFEAQGYRLIGGRADYLAHQRAAVVVYQHGAHVINVFSWAAGRGRVPSDTTRNGYHMAFWSVGNIEYCAVSDTGWNELLGLVQLLRELGDREIAAH